MWEELIKANWILDNSIIEPLDRIRKSRIPNDEYLYRTGLAPITSFMAIEGVESIDEAFIQFQQKAHQYHLDNFNITNKTLTTYAKEKAEQKARKYNTIKKQPKKKE